MKEDRTDASSMDQAAGAAYQAVQAQRAVSQAVQMQRAARGAGAAHKTAHSSQAAYAVTAAAQGGGTAAGAAAGTALGGPLGTVVGTLATSKTFRKVIAGIFAALFLWMFLIANMIGIILTYLGFADADAFANEAQSAELSNIKARIEAILKKEEYKQEILALLEGARDKGLREIEADKGAKYPDHGLTVVDEYESRLKTNTSYYLAILLSEVWDTSGINSFLGYPSDWGDMSTDLTSKYDAYFEEAAQAYGVPVALLKAMGMAESGFNQNAVSGAGAIGVMQLMPGTAASLGVNPHNARENIMGGAKYIAKNLEQFKNHSNGLELAIAAYNAGPGNVIKYGYQIPPFKETQNYVKRVLGYITIQERRAGSTEDPDEDLSGPYSQLKEAVSENADSIFSWSVTGEGETDTTKTVYYQLQESGKTERYREEYNEMLRSKVSGTNNSIFQERYLTVSIHKKSVDEARTYFARVGTDIVTHLAKLSSTAEELDAGDRLQIFRDFFKAGDPPYFPFDLKASAKRGGSFKDWICPESMEFHKDFFKIDGRYGRVLYMQDYASYVKDDMISELCGLSRDLMLSIDILPVPTDEAVREIQNRLLGVETNVANWQRRQNANNNFSAVVPYDMELQRKETKEMLDDLTTRDQRMMFGLLTMVHMADSKKQLDSDTETLLSVGRKSLCQMSVLKWQQVDGLNTVLVLPYGLRKIHALRTLTTESTAVLIPFHTQEVMQPGGIYYGQNAVSKNMIVADRRKLLNGNSFRLGVSGSGKSFSAKEEIVDLALSTDDDILILDPESEFVSLVETLDGEVIRISATSDTHLNALDMDAAYGDDKNPLIEKSEFILSLFEQLVGAGNLSAKEKSILDRCTADVYRDYIRSGYREEVPTLKDLYRALMLQPEEEARGLALSSELFINGSLNTFAQPTNVNTKSRIIDYDIRELGEQLMPLGMLVTLDSIFNRVIQNWKKGRTTWIFADEFYLLFRYQYSADFFYRLYKRIRKYYGFVTRLTQNVEELLKSDTARLMLANSEFLILLNQSSTDREELARLLNISDNQLSYITNVGAGHGLIRCSGNIVPFENTFPKNTKLFELMSTSAGDFQGRGWKDNGDEK